MGSLNETLASYHIVAEPQDNMEDQSLGGLLLSGHASADHALQSRNQAHPHWGKDLVSEVRALLPN